MKKIIIYDFDGTLTPEPLPKFAILKKCGYPNGSQEPSFLAIVKEKMQNENMDVYEAIYATYLQVIKESGYTLTDDNFSLGADKVIYNNKVKEFLTFLCDNGIENYLLSSGIKVFLERTIIAHLFARIYATTFTYQDGVATGVDYLMSDKRKVEVIKEILKSIGNKEDDCQNVIYIGDGLTDSYAMDYVKCHGGTSIFVYTNKDNPDLIKIEEEQVINFSSYADFSEDSELTTYIKKLCLTNKK